MFDAAWVLAASSVTDLLAGETPVSMVPRPNSARFRCRDRRLFISIIWPKWFATLCDVLGAPELATDPRFADAAAIRANGDALIAAVEERLTTRDDGDWATELAARGVPASPIETIEQAAQWPQVSERRLIEHTSVDHETLEIVGSGIVFAQDGPELGGPVPTAGEHTRETLADVGYAPAEIEALQRTGVIAIG